MKEELWKSIQDYEGLYEVSNQGRVKSLKFGKERILKAVEKSHGYLSVNLYKGKCKALRAHKLVAMAFLDHIPCGDKMVIDHKNNIKTDNRVENLQIITQRENSSKDRKGGSSKHVGVSRNGKGWRARIHVNDKLKYLGTFQDEAEASICYQNALHNLNN
tara:strand:+ start:3055 stop:3534 length:480 start_codon:yes stop_codon:yes gene_type:complete